MVLYIARADVGKGNRIQPPQHTEFGLWVTQPIEDHDAQKRFHIHAVAGAPKHLAQLCKAQRIPQFLGLVDERGKYGITETARKISQQL